MADWIGVDMDEATPNDPRVPARIWAKIDHSGECWTWTGSTSANGYGKTKLDGRYAYLHRLMYEALVGPLDAGQQVDHQCHVKRCCRPSHLLPVNNSGNGQNRSGAQVNSRSGVRNVFWERHVGKWRVQMRVDGRNVSGGLYDSLDDAAERAREMRAALMPNSLR